MENKPEPTGRENRGLPGRGESDPEQQAASFVDRQIGVMRFIAVLGVISSSLLAVALFVAAIARTFFDIYESLADFGTKDAVKHLLLAGIEQADVLLVAVALMIVGFGLYTLFIGVPVNIPRWLIITSFTELKTKLTEVIVVAILVDFFSQVIYESDNPQHLLLRAAASALMVVAVGIFGLSHRKAEH